MFTRRTASEEKITKNVIEKENEKTAPAESVPVKPADPPARSSNVNKILKGSKLIGDINVTCDLEVSGDVDGNISSMQDSNITIKGTCKGNIETKEGSVDIQGDLQGGNITAGKDVRISGRFSGGEIRAAGKIFVNGEFNGKLEGSDVEIGANSKGKGEIFYSEFISISRGAKVDVQIAQAKQGLKEVKSPVKQKKMDTEPVMKSAEGE